MDVGSWMSPAKSTQPAHFPVAVCTVPATVKMASLALDGCNVAWTFEELTGFCSARDALVWPWSNLFLNERSSPQSERRMPCCWITIVPATIDAAGTFE